MSIPDWVGPVAEYILEVGLVNTLKISALALVGATLIGILLGTLLTIDFLPTRALIRLYIEVFRGLPSVRAALDAVPDPLAGLLVHRGRGGAAGRFAPDPPLDSATELS